MQLGMVGLGRMGANIVRRLLNAGHECVVFDVNPDAIKTLASEGAIGADSMDDFVAKLTKPRAAWVMVPAGDITEQTVTELAGRMEAGDTIIDGGNSYYRDDIERAKRFSGQGIHYVDCGTSGGVWGLDRGYCLMIGGETPVVERLSPLFASIAPGVEGAARTPGRSGDLAPSEQGYLHCGPNGAGHFVKMVHNGIEYGIMASYAEGLNILRNANAGKVTARGGRRDRAARAARVLPVRHQYRRGCGGLAPRERDLFLVARPDCAVARRITGSGGVLGPRVRLWRGALDGDRRDRGGRTRSGALERAVLPVRVAPAGSLRQPGLVGDAQAVRRPRRETGELIALLGAVPRK